VRLADLNDMDSAWHLCDKHRVWFVLVVVFTLDFTGSTNATIRWF
jgi:hypothetical protein